MDAAELGLDHAEFEAFVAANGLATLPSEQLQQLDSPELILHIAMRRMQRDVLRGRRELCRRTIDALALEPSSLTPAMPTAVWLTALAGAVYTRPNTPNLAKMLSELHDQNEACGNHIVATQAHALQLLLRIRQGVPSVEEIDALVDDIERTRFTRIILDVPELRPLIERSRMPFAQQLLRERWAACEPSHTLSTQELRILHAMVDGRRAGAIADEFVISIDTVYTHVRNIYRKLGVHSSAEAIRRAQRMGIAQRLGCMA